MPRRYGPRFTMETRELAQGRRSARTSLNGKTYNAHVIYLVETPPCRTPAATRLLFSGRLRSRCRYRLMPSARCFNRFALLVVRVRYGASALPMVVWLALLTICGKPRGSAISPLPVSGRAPAANAACHSCIFKFIAMSTAPARLASDFLSMPRSFHSP